MKRGRTQAVNSKSFIVTLPALGFLGVMALGSATGCSTKQPPVQCVAQRNTYAAKYILAVNPAQLSNECFWLATFRGEMLGVYTFVPNPYVPGDTIKMAIQSDEMGTLARYGEFAPTPVTDPDPSHKLYAQGPFTTMTPDEGNICHVPTLAPAALTLGAVPSYGDAGADEDAEAGDASAAVAAAAPAVPVGAAADGGVADASAGGDASADAAEASAGDASAADGAVSPDGPGADGAQDSGGEDGGEDAGGEGQPPVDVKYEWSNIRVWVTPALIGVHWTGELTYTKDGCSAPYHVVAVAPAAWCDDGNGNPDESLCSAAPNGKLPIGSGISPDLPVYCDPATLLCMLKSDNPF